MLLYLKQGDNFFSLSGHESSDLRKWNEVSVSWKFWHHSRSHAVRTAIKLNDNDLRKIKKLQLDSSPVVIFSTIILPADLDIRGCLYDRADFCITKIFPLWQEPIFNYAKTVL